LCLQNTKEVAHIAVFRVERTNDYTIMANHHLRKKGLLSQMLSLPEDWDYTLRGLAIINEVGVDRIREAVKELEAAGYIVRDPRKRNRKGQFQGAAYTIYERPATNLKSPNKGTPASNNPISEKPMLENPIQANSTQEPPTLANPTQLITNIPITKSSNTNGLNTNQSNPYQSTPPAKAGSRMDAMGLDMDKISSNRQLVRNRINYNFLIHKFDQTRLDEVVEIIAETLSTDRESLTISGERIPVAIVKQRMMQITDEHIEYIFDCLASTRTRIKNIKKYLVAALYNAPQTIASYYTALVNHDDHQMMSYLDDDEDENTIPRRRDFL